MMSLEVVVQAHLPLLVLHADVIRHTLVDIFDAACVGERDAIAGTDL